MSGEAEKKPPFQIGEYYLEVVKTGKLSLDGPVPTVTPMTHEKIYNFVGGGSIEKVKALKALDAKDFKSGTKYVRLFRTPVPEFDERGELLRPKFVTEGFYDHEEVDRVCSFGTAAYEFRAEVDSALIPFFEDEKPVCPLTK